MHDRAISRGEASPSRSRQPRAASQHDSLPTWFLDQTAEWANDRVATALSALLAALHQGDTSLFAPQERADEVAKQFRVAVAAAGANAAS